MDTDLLSKKFARLGARAFIRPREASPLRSATGPVVIDVARDRHGEFFDIQADDDADVAVLDLQPRARHLLLMVRQPGRRPGDPEQKDKFLCGHDERHWFVAAVPERAAVSSVVTAMDALKPALIRTLERGKKGKHKKRLRRKTDTFTRQGEWFFVPAPDVVADEKLVLRNEPLRRGAGKPHNCQFLYRVGGTTVYVCTKYPNGLTETEYKAAIARKPLDRRLRWVVMRRNPEVFVRGAVSHPDHATIHLHAWHRVLMNTENQSRAMRSVAFLD